MGRLTAIPSSGMAPFPVAVKMPPLVTDRGSESVDHPSARVEVGLRDFASLDLASEPVDQALESKYG